MSQPRVLSALEAACNVMVGLGVAVVTQLVVFPFVGIVATPRQTLMAAGAFTGVSLARSTLLRRLFDRIGRPPPVPPGGRVKPWGHPPETGGPGLRTHGHICDRGSTR